MNKNILYALVFTILFFALILPETINPSKGIIFTVEEWVGLIFLFLCVVFLRNPISKIIKKFDQNYPWKTAIKQRLLAQVLIMLLATSIISAIIYVPTSFYIKKEGIPQFYQKIIEKKNEINDTNDSLKRKNKTQYKEWQLTDFLALIAEVTFFCLLLIFVIEETFMFLTLQSRKKLELETLLKEQAQLKANVLSKQLDPHFMFNTLNVLSGLIYKDVDKSAQFINELSKVYRYVLEQSEELVSTVEKEFQFLESYMYLLKIRFDDKIPITMDIPDNRKNWFLPSMTLELLVENAIKHNIVDAERPLRLSFRIVEDRLIVRNNLQLRNNHKESLGLGLKNLKKRLELLGKKNYNFDVIKKEFVAIVPLINPKDV